MAQKRPCDCWLGKDENMQCFCALDEDEQLQFDLLGQYMRYYIRMKCLNKFPHWHNVIHSCNGIGLTKGYLMPAIGVFVKTLEQGNFDHRILSFEDWKTKKMKYATEHQT